MRKSPPICLVFCHPVRVGNIPYLIYQTLIKKHFGTPILEDSISVGCYLGVFKCESPPPICMVPCHPLHIGGRIKSSQVGVPTCFFIRVLYIRLDVAYVHGMAGNHAEPCRTMQNHADRWGLSHLEPPKSQPTLVE